ncbi:MAG: neutral zinc metallopeptidase, partial [Pseudonocardiales bacterium]|nr:neutral zinc metallopeptidase [Pseudonocardiales bacterium]MBV9028844.1 neutral zinc metallopeptidase [Pseudonocardiales bacterium]
MRFDEGAELDTSQVDDQRGGGGGGIGGWVGMGGGVSVVGLLLYFLLSYLGGGSSSSPLSGGLSGLGTGQSVNDAQISQSCRSGRDANTALDCEVVGVDNSLDAYWSGAFAGAGKTYRKPRIDFFNGEVRSGCGSASSEVGPFYCPADSEIYIDLSFFQELQQRFGAQGGPFARAYVIAHEYGHHVQNLLGTSRRVQAGVSGPASASVRLELQADCYAGVWAKNASTTPGASGRPLIVDVTDTDVRAALDTAAHIGDDYIQTQLGGGRVNESQFTHGTSEQREKWYGTGYQSGNPKSCNTFDT